MRTELRAFRNAALVGMASLALGCLACVSSAQSAGVAALPAQYRLHDVEIALSRYGCLGRCPVYTLTLRGDGTGLYEGSQYVRTSGPHRFEVARDVFVRLLQDCYDTRFFDLTGADLRPRNFVLDPGGDARVRVEPVDGFTLDAEEIGVQIKVGEYTKYLQASGHSRAADRLFTLAAAIDAAAGSEHYVGFRQTPVAARTREYLATPLQQALVPPWVTGAVAASGLLDTHDFDTAINPFFHRGDFDGDGAIDFAAWVLARDGGGLGILFVHRGSGRVTVIGSGSRIPGARSDDLTWADAWSLFEKGPVPQNRSLEPVPLLPGDAVLLVSTDGAGGILWWTGTGYRWYTQGDEPWQP